MEATNKQYDFQRSKERIDAILSENDSHFEEKNLFPVGLI